MGLGGVIVNRGGGLGSQIAGFRIEVVGADAVIATGTGELHAALDALDSVGFHRLDCKSSEGGYGHASGAQLR